MITVHDKIPFFRKIMENEFKVQLDQSLMQLDESYTERKAKLEKHLNQEIAERTERQRLLLDEERRNRLGQAEADLKLSLLHQRQGFIQELKTDLTRWLKDWLASPEFMASLSNLQFQRAEGPASLQAAFQAQFPNTDYAVKAIDGLMLYDDLDGARIDLTLSRWLQRYEKVLSQTFNEMVGV